MNLERDLCLADAVGGYVVTPKARETLERISEAVASSSRVRAWSLTGAYGTGKSAFAHFLTALVAPSRSPERREAFRVLNRDDANTGIVSRLLGSVSARGLIRAVATGRREPLSSTLVRGLDRGASLFWKGTRGRKPRVLSELRRVAEELDGGGTVDDARVIALVLAVAHASQSGVLVVIDELGKNLEYAARTRDAQDVYLLQRLAELPAADGQPPVLVITLLQQGFSEYGHALASAERAEWEKVQGRFEDIAFADSPEQMLLLLGQAIRQDLPRPLERRIRAKSSAWALRLRRQVRDQYLAGVLDPDTVANVYPLHPLSAVALPRLCMKYAQNDRSLFNFLASNEPHSFSRFLEERSASNDELPYLGLAGVYDYFADTLGLGLALGPHYQRLVEVRSRIAEQRGLDDDELAALKVIGVLNLMGASGPLRASREIVIAGLCSDPDSEAEIDKWSSTVDRLIDARVVVYRRQIDELRVWEGSDFDVEQAVGTAISADRRTLDVLLTQMVPLAPKVAQRHSYQTGTLRYFEQVFALDGCLGSVRSKSPDSDGVVAYLVSAEKLSDAPAAACSDGKPLVVLVASEVQRLHSAAREVAALDEMQRHAIELQRDAVARREVRHRLDHARRALDGVFRETFDTQLGAECWVGGKPFRGSGAEFNGRLSTLCDEAYPRGVTLWNEMINRRELTSQGAKARRKLIAAMLTDGDQERLAMTGNGPEVSMYSSVLLRTGIHQLEHGSWHFTVPHDRGIRAVWDAIEQFVLSASETPRTLDGLNAILQSPPFGVKPGVIPVILAAVVLRHSEDVSIYKDGTFVPVLGAEHFELLVKQPGRYAVKHFEVAGVRREVLALMEQVLSDSATRSRSGSRNRTLLAVVRPLVRAATSLPAYSQRTDTVSASAQAVRAALLSATQPDELLFSDLPTACGLEPITGIEESTGTSHQEFVTRLLSALHELQSAYDAVLAACRTLIYEAFGVRSDSVKLREDLAVRARYLMGQVIEPRLKSFVRAATFDEASDRAWLESLVMIIADRPAETWSDEDRLSFEIKLSDLARRFANLEALQKDRALDSAQGARFDARRVTITAQDGTETHRLVLIEESIRPRLDALVSKLLAHVPDLETEQQYQAVAALLAEKLFSSVGSSSFSTTDHIERRQKHG